MIAVKTRMRSMPKACSACGYYRPGTATIYDRPTCGAIAAFSDCGKPINARGKDDVQTTKQRPKWCPLVDIAMTRGVEDNHE